MKITFVFFIKHVGGLVPSLASSEPRFGAVARKATTAP